MVLKVLAFGPEGLAFGPEGLAPRPSNFLEIFWSLGKCNIERDSAWRPSVVMALEEAQQALQLSRACHGLAGARRAHSPTEYHRW